MQVDRPRIGQLASRMALALRSAGAGMPVARPGPHLAGGTAGGALDWLRQHRNQVLVGALVVVAVVLAALIFRDLLFPSAPTTSNIRTATVEQGTVQTQVTGTGTVVPVDQQNVNFRVSGQLMEVDVKVGDHVTAGQVLAKLDPTTFQNSLQQAQAGVQQAQGNLNNTVQGNEVQSAQNTLINAQNALTAAQNQANTLQAADNTAINSAQRQLSFDQQLEARDSATLSANQAALSRCQSTQVPTTPPSPGTPPTPRPTPNCSAQMAAVNASVATVNADRAKLVADQNNVTAARSKSNTDRATSVTTIQQARGTVVTSQDALNSQNILRPNNITIQQGGLSSAAAAASTAQTNLNDTILTAPVDGTVAAINGAIGETPPQPTGPTAGIGATTQAPGTVAPQPAIPGASASTPFLVLSNVSSFQVVAPFAEGDAARVKPNQDVNVTFDAIPGLTLPGSVLAVAPAATVIQNVTNYFVTVTLNELDPRLLAGMTANAMVVIGQAQDVLTVPNAAIQTVNGQSFVNVLQPDGTIRRAQVQTGLMGDTTTEIVSGVQAGDRVVLPQLRVPTPAPGGGPGGGGGEARGPG